MNDDFCYVCLKWGTKYSAEYVNKLVRMIRKWNITPVDIYCYTDDPTGIDGSIGIIPIQSNAYETWWYKLPLLVEPALGQYRTKILLDLDVVIHNNISNLHTYACDNLVVCRSFWKNPQILSDTREKNTLYNSSVMVWTDASYVYEHFRTDPERFMAIYKGIDRFLWYEPLTIDTLPQDIVYSYRRGATLHDTRSFVKRDNYAIALFHGTPKQTDMVDDPLVKEYWNEL